MSENIQCSECNETIESNARFCRFCGHEAPSKPAGCSSCHEPIGELDKFCRRCGASVAGAAVAEEVSAAPKKKRKKKRPNAEPLRSAKDRNIPDVRPRRRARRHQPNRTPYIAGGAILMVLVVIGLVVNDASERDAARPNTAAAPQPSQGGAPPPEMVQGSDGNGPMDISGVITLSPEMLKSAPAARAIYIIARAPGQIAGMPIAAVKLRATKKPTPYAIGPADVMNPEVPFSGPVQLSARWDTDGEASSKSPTDIIGGPETNPVKPGSKGVDIVLATQYGASGAEAQQPGGQPESAPAADGGMKIMGTISVDPSLKDSTPTGGFFFIIAYPAGVQGGPPLAARKIPASAEPTPFAIGPGDMMGQGDFNQPMTLKVRWDQDGTTGTEPGDLLGGAVEDPVKPGSKDVKMLLTRKK